MQVTMTTTVRQNRWPWLMLPARLMLFAFWQMALVLVLLLLAAPDAWQTAAAWWPLTAVLANLVCIGLLRALYRQEGLRYADIFRIQRRTVRKDLLIMLGALILLGPVAFLPNILTATWLFGSQEAAMALFLQPLPAWGLILATVFFPVTVALSELPLYFAYCMPRLEARSGNRLWALLLPSLFLAVQHTTLPLLFDQRFVLWRLLMFVPFALFLGLLLRWRSQLLPYLVVVHGLLYLAMALLIPK